MSKQLKRQWKRFGTGNVLVILCALMLVGYFAQSELALDGVVVQESVGIFKAGSGTPDTTQTDGSGYFTTTLEVDGISRFDGAIDANSTSNFAEPMTLQEGVASTTGTFSGVLTANGAIDANSTSNFQGAATFQASIIRTAQEFIINSGGRPGSGAGWLTTGTAANLFNYTLPASKTTTATLVIPVSGIHVGDTITGWKLVGQIESAGNTVLVSGDLRKITTAAGANVDASVGAITRISVTADTAVAQAATGLTEVAAANESFYVLVSATTTASTDIDLQGVTVTVTQN